MLTRYELKLPRSVYSGEGALDRIPELLEKHGVKRLALFSDRAIEKTGLLELPLSRIRKTEAQLQCFLDLAPEPSYMEAQAVIDECRSFQPDMIMAVGGGSVMDTAKLASLLMTGEHSVKELADDTGLAGKTVKTMMIPTTAGTGAEATPNAIVAFPEKQLKIGIVSTEMIPDEVILDAEMIKRLPRPIAASTGIDALCHAIECFTSNKANPFSDLFALQALELILHNIEAACNDPDALEAKNKMLIGSFYAGVAITASGTTGVHALSYPLGGRYHIAHGVSNAMLLMPVMHFNEPVCRPLFAKAYERCFGGAGMSEEEKSLALLKRFDEIVKGLDIPVSLQAFGIGREDLEELVSAGMEVKRLLVNNMRTITAEDAREIYLQLM